MKKNRIMKPRFKWFVALLLVFSMMVTTYMPALAALSTEAEAGTPKLRIVSTLTDGGKYLEMGLNVNSGEKNFQSAGVVLTYDPDMLTPIIWGELTDAEGNAVTGEIALGVETVAQDIWTTKAKILPTKGADELSGKLAKAVKTSDKGYLFLSAETAMSDELVQLLPGEEETSTEPDAGSDGTEAVDESGESGETTDPTEPTEPTDPTAGITLASGCAISYIAEATAAIPQATTVRFKVNEKTAASTDSATGVETPAVLYSLADLAASVDVLVYDSTDAETASDAVNQTMLVNSSLAGINQTATKLAGVSYIADNANYTTAGFDSAAELSFVWVEEGVSLNTGTGGVASADDFVSITMFDWDDTLLGALVIPKGSDATETVKQFVQERSATAEQLAGGFYYDDSSLPFTNKRGYSFDMEDYGVWLDYNSETLTHYGSNVQGVLLPEPTADTGAVDLTAVNENLLMKACYEANSELHTGTGVDARYTTSVVSTERVAGNVFIVTIRVKRENTVDGKTVGVARLGKPAVRVRMTSGSVTVPSQIVMSTSDEVVLQTVPSKLVDQYAFSVVETYQNDNWPNAGIQSTEIGDVKGEIQNNLVSDKTWTGEGYTAEGFLYEGTLVYMNKNLRPGGNSGLINKEILDDMKFNYSMVAATPPTAVFQARNAVPLLQKAFNTLNGITDDSPTKPEYKDLTYKQMQYAIAHSGELLTEDID